jgi:hypothetical protein
VEFMVDKVALGYVSGGVLLNPLSGSFRQCSMQVYQEISYLQVLSGIEK